jgi:glycosyltransferase involved in cell wall biosynthesis
MKPVLSICVLTYNRPKFLVELLNSIFNLDESFLDQIEIIVIDNGSTDETWKTLEKFSYRKNFMSERFLENKRGSASYLELIKRANGDFVIFPGDDDVFKTNALSEGIKFLGEFGENYSMIAFGADTMNDHGKSNLLTYRPPSKYSRDKIAAKLLVDSVFWMPCTITRTSILKNKSDPRTVTSFDWWIWINGVINGEIKFFNSDLISYRQHDGQEQKSFLKLNWEVDSLLMLNRELESDFGRYITGLLESKTNFLEQLELELRNVKFDEFQVMKWSLILTKISKLSNSINLLRSIGNPAKIWNDLRFVESWFQQKLSTDEILNFFEFWGVEVKIATLSKGKNYLKDLDSGDSKYEKTPVLRLYSQNDLNDFQFILAFQKENEIMRFIGSSEDVLQSNLKSLFGLTIREYREAETFNQITPFESKVLRIVRLLKGSKFANLIKSWR